MTFYWHIFVDSFQSISWESPVFVGVSRYITVDVTVTLGQEAAACFKTWSRMRLRGVATLF